MKKLLYIFIMIVCSSIVFAGLDIGLPSTLPHVSMNDPDDVATLGGDNNWTGQNTFNNVTIINYKVLNVTGNITAENFCYLNGTCVSDQIINRHNDLSNLLWSTAGHTIDTSFDMNNQDIINVDAITMSGTFRQGSDGNFFIYDLDDEIHHLNADLNRFDELRSNTFTTPLNVETFYNSTGHYINITASDKGKISFIGSVAGSSESESFAAGSYILPLTSGTEQTPILNRVYAYISGGEPTWGVSTTDVEFKHAMVARVLVGAIDNVPYAGALQEDGDSGFIKRTQRRFRKEGLLYEEGFDYTATPTELLIDGGSFINGIYDQTITGTLTMTDGFYLLHTDGSFHWYNGFDEILEYSNGGTIGNNKYFNVIWGLTPQDGTGNIYAVVQDEPDTEYNAVDTAWSDSENTLSVYPSEEFLKIYFLPVARTVIKKGSNAQLLPNGAYAEDYRGGVAGGAASGGGLAETDPVWTIDKPYYFKNDSWFIIEAGLQLLDDIKLYFGTGYDSSIKYDTSLEALVIDGADVVVKDTLKVNKLLYNYTQYPYNINYQKGAFPLEATGSLVGTRTSPNMAMELNNGVVDMTRVQGSQADINVGDIIEVTLCTNTILNGLYVVDEVSNDQGGYDYLNLTASGYINTAQIGQTETDSSSCKSQVWRIQLGQESGIWQMAYYKSDDKLTNYAMNKYHYTATINNVATPSFHRSQGGVHYTNGAGDYWGWSAHDLKCMAFNQTGSNSATIWCGVSNTADNEISNNRVGIEPIQMNYETRVAGRVVYVGNPRDYYQIPVQTE